MPEIKLNGPAVVNGAVRYPAEGAIPVTEAEAKRLLDGGFLDLGDHDGDAEDEVAEDDIVEDDGLNDEKVEDLKSIAEREQVDLGTATKKADIISAIRAHRLTVEQ